MSQQWYYNKSGQRQGPVTSEKLKELAAQGYLVPTDLVWKEGMNQWTEARNLKGLFPTPTKPVSPESHSSISSAAEGTKSSLFCRNCGKEVNERAIVCPGCGMQPLAGNQFCRSCGAQTNPAASICVKCGIGLSKGNVDNSPLTFLRTWPAIAASLLFCFPLGYVLVWTHPTWSRRKKVVWSCAWVVLLVLAGFARRAEEKKVQRIIANAHQSWATGDESQAVSLYHAAIDKGVDLIDESDRSLVLSRVVDYEAENGHEEEAKKILRNYPNEHIYPESVAGKTLLRQYKEEMAQIEKDQEQKKTEQKSWSRANRFERLAGILDEMWLGKELTFGNSQVYYQSPVTEAEARRLGDFLVTVEFFDDTPKTVQVTKSSNTYELRMPIKTGMEQDLDFIESIKWIGAAIAESVFDGAHLDVHLCDDELDTIRVVPCN